MNLDNANMDEVQKLLALLQAEAGIDAATARRVVAALHREGFGMVLAPCPGCRTVHASYPQAVAYHSPVCPDQGKCAACGAPQNWGKGHEVGMICLACYMEP